MTKVRVTYTEAWTETIECNRIEYKSNAVVLILDECGKLVIIPYDNVYKIEIL